MEDFVRFVVNAVERDIEGPVAPLYPIAPGTPTRPNASRRRSPAIAAWARCASATPPASQMQNDGYGSIILSAAQIFYDRRLRAAGRCRALSTC